MTEPRFEWRGKFAGEELNALHAEAFASPFLEIDWTGRVQAHSLGWLTARDARGLVGFVNVAWDGGVHAFVPDTVAGAARRRPGIGTRLIAVAAAEAPAAGCEWHHVDFEEYRPFYLGAYGFEPAPAGLTALKVPGGAP